MDFGSMLNKLKRDAATASSSTTTSRGNGGVAGNKRPRARDNVSDGRDGAETTEEKRKWRNLPYPTVPVRTVYLVCPPGVQTGGPHAMHQLCDAINNRRTNTGAEKSSSSTTAKTSPTPRLRGRMLYLREKGGRGGGVHHDRNARCVPAYRQYDAPPAPCLPGEDEEEEEDGDAGVGDSGEEKVEYTSDLVVWPECWTHLIDSLRTTGSPTRRTSGVRRRRRRRLHQTCIWWLSVDNNNGRYTDWDRNDVLHLHQSEYARRYLVKNGARHVVRMTEYVPGSSESASLSPTESSPRDLEVLYNPLKGMHYTDEILKRSGRSIRFTPIGGGDGGRKRITPDEVTALLHRAKVYIDFGPHPGMDRLPREAALARCVVITNAEGAARYEEDVPIPNRYKIHRFDVDRIHKLLRESLDGYKARAADFDAYRKWIGGQAQKMVECVEALEEKLVVRRG